MIARRMVAIGLGLALVGPFLASPGLAADGGSTGGYMYYYFKSPQQLDLDLSRVAIMTEAPGDVPAARSAAVFGGLDAAQVEHYALDRWYTAPLPMGKRSAGTVEDVLRTVARDSGRYVSPVFVDERGLPLLITPDILVRFGADVTAERAEEIIAQSGAGVIVDRNFGGLARTYRLRSEAREGLSVLSDANLLAQMAEVEWAEPDKLQTGQLALTPNDTYYSQQWALNQGNNVDLDAPQAWDITTGDPNVIIVVFDLGIQFDHPDLNLRAGADFTGRNVANGGPYNSCDNHGTEVAGCISAKINNASGVVGICPNCRTASAKIGEANIPCDGYFSSQESWLVSALSWAVSIGARASNSSFSYGQSSALTQGLHGCKDERRVPLCGDRQLGCQQYQLSGDDPGRQCRRGHQLRRFACQLQPVRSRNRLCGPRPDHRDHRSDRFGRRCVRKLGFRRGWHVVRVALRRRCGGARLLEEPRPDARAG